MRRILVLCTCGLVLSMLVGACGAAAPATSTPIPTQQVSPTPAPTNTQAAAGTTDRVNLSRAFVEQLSTGDYRGATAHFDQSMLAAAPPETLEQIWSQLEAQSGAFKRQVGTHLASQAPYEIVYVTCEFEKASLDLKLVFDQSERIAGFFIEPVVITPTPGGAAVVEQDDASYVRRDAFQELDVTVGGSPWALSGTLALPLGEGPFPAVVLVHGSGPNDRDETIGPNKPFRDLAHGLASHGIAVLRYEKRTRVYPQQMAALKELTVKEETIDDALAAVALLRTLPAIDQRQIVVLGHSLGGMLIPRIGLADQQLAGLVVLAGPSRPLEDLVLDQYTYLFLLDGSLSPDEDRQLAALQAQIDAVKSPTLSTETPSMTLLFNIPASYWLDLRDTRAAEQARELSQPLLILQGGRDYQVPPAELDGWKIVLADKEQVQYKTYPDLNHLFIAGVGPSTPSEYQQPGHVAPQVVLDIASWIKGLVG